MYHQRLREQAVYLLLLLLIDSRLKSLSGERVAILELYTMNKQRL